MNKILISLLITYYLLLNPFVVLAQTPTPTSTATAQDIQDKVQARIEEINNTAKKRSFWGTLTEINGTTLSITGPRGNKRIKTDDTTVFVNSTKKTIKIADLEIGNFLIALGYLNEDGTLSGKRVTALTTEPKPVTKRFAINGKVNEIVDGENVLSITSGKDNQTTNEVTFTGKTVITKKVDGSVKKILFSAIAVGDRIVIVATKDSNTNGYTAKIAHVIPGLATGQENSVTPTLSSKLTPTPTNKLTPIPTPTPSE